jgi:beta-glucosidase
MKNNFLWGVANAAFQVEGSPKPSDWTAWTEEKGRIFDGSNAEKATDFWNRYEEDLKLAADLGSKAFRMSVAWERIETSEGVFEKSAIEQYRKIIQAVRAHGMEPLLTLHHFVNPLWLAKKGGVLAPDFPELFARFSVFVVGELSKDDLVLQWSTFNEPNIVAVACFLAGEFPPGAKNDFKRATQATFQLSRAHILAVSALRKEVLPRFPKVKVGIVIHLRDFQPKTRNPLDRLIAKISDWTFNRQILKAALTGKIFAWYPGSKFYREDLSHLYDRKGIDFLGINYYGRTMVKFQWTPPFVAISEGEDGPKNDMGWEIYPQGLENVLCDAHRRYGLPILITENGTADHDDSRRPEFIREHLRALKRAIDKGVPVEGYLHWSLTDNFEWAHGHKPRFGLVEIDYATMARKPRPSYYLYQKLIREYSTHDTAIHAPDVSKNA